MGMKHHSKSGSSGHRKRKIDSHKKAVTSDLLPLSSFISSPRLLAENAIDSLDATLVDAMLPTFLKNRNREDVLQLMAEELKAMSRRKILNIIEGKLLTEGDESVPDEVADLFADRKDDDADEEEFDISEGGSAYSEDELESRHTTPERYQIRTSSLASEETEGKVSGQDLGGESEYGQRRVVLDDEEVRTEAEVEGTSEIEKQTVRTENGVAEEENHVIIVGAQEQQQENGEEVIVNGAAPAEEDEIEEGEIRDSPEDEHLSTISTESLNSDRRVVISSRRPRCNSSAASGVVVSVSSASTPSSSSSPPPSDESELVVSDIELE
ncbi:hypothetical protein WR25_03879 [Diploscapter pachys]|uniref:Uncharacterized protein n=1 Tax=Diploscapter pachys TaxID=2018661 RepID=A0A2A2JMV8_9BILA|nr:hypothetical protein WR25_03879 [Diploscapter pachys]